MGVNANLVAICHVLVAGRVVTQMNRYLPAMFLIVFAASIGARVDSLVFIDVFSLSVTRTYHILGVVLEIPAVGVKTVVVGVGEVSCSLLLSLRFPW